MSFCPEDLLNIYRNDYRVAAIIEALDAEQHKNICLRGLLGSAAAVVGAVVYKQTPYDHVFVLPDKESAAYFYNDLEALFEEKGENSSRKRILFFPTSYKRPYEIEKTDSINLLNRTEVLNRISEPGRSSVIVTYPEALCEKVVSGDYIRENTLKIEKGEAVDLDFVTDVLIEYRFERVDFVVEPGQFAVRGGIIDVYSFASDYPYRIEFFGNEVDSIRTFNPMNQLSLEKLTTITIVPNVQDRQLEEQRQSFLEALPKRNVLWFDDIQLTHDLIEQEFEKAHKAFQQLSPQTDSSDPAHQLDPEQLFCRGKAFLSDMLRFSLIEMGTQFSLRKPVEVNFDIHPQPTFNKNFDLLIENLQLNATNQIRNLIVADNPKQLERIEAIFDDLSASRNDLEKQLFRPAKLALHQGFVDYDLQLACYTDHQIFDRHHRFYLRDSFTTKESLTIKELYNLQPGDFVTHIDHGIGRFDGLEKIVNNGKPAEAIRLIYKNNDILYVSIHSLHRIAKYVGKEGTPPQLNKLGSNAWNKVKSKTKQKVKDIAKDLIQLYAKRIKATGMAFSPDTYLQHELEASFIYEDTPDQLKSTQAVKEDMESPHPMDRLVCGDVGFGKTEVAIRAAFKAVADSKQVAVLVPTTILALQHYKTFSERLKDFPCKIDYLNRFKSTKQQKATLAEVKAGSVDILIGTHRLISKDVEFSDLGLLIVDEEQKFGVGAKEKLKQLKVNVDTLTLTATPIPRTLQFSLMGARDLSIINTPPANRHPVQTEIRGFGEQVIREAVEYELSRGGQVFFVHNRVQNIIEVAEMIRRFVPGIRIAVGHGQMEGPKLEKIMLDFIEGQYDVLVATTIIESGLDIPNVNTIIINDAQNHGLSDLHQLRGRVGRSNKRAFCYLLSPPLSSLTDEARRRLKAIEEFSNIGSGFNIAMRDLDIRGAGNLLGGEQSGFIADIGYEMYQKILDEALHELKTDEFKNLYVKPGQQVEFVRDCQIESDLEVLIPDEYISNIAERLSLYRELDGMNNEADLQAFARRMEDRFGPLPQPTSELLDTLRLRWLAKEIGFEKVRLKMKRMYGYFVSNPQSDYYRSPIFAAFLQYVQNHPQHCRIREKGDKLSVLFTDIESIGQALEVMGPIREAVCHA